MAAFADAIDLLKDIIQDQQSVVGAKYDRSGQLGAIALCYVGFAFGWFIVLGNFSCMDFSAIVTGAACVQCLGFTLLNFKVRSTKSVAGLSSGMFVLFILHLTLRLTSTCIKNGYIPVDRSGDYMYQFLDLVSLGMCCNILYRIHKVHAYTYQEGHDTLPLMPIVVPCVTLAFFVHGTFNKSFFFDVIWAMSTNLETFVLLPQLWMMSRMGGRVDAMTGHFVACIVTSTVLQFTFWWWTGAELEKRGPNVAHQVIVGFQSLKLLLSADFMYYYTVAWLGGTEVILPAAQEL